MVCGLLLPAVGAQEKSLLETIREDQPIDFCGETVPLKVPDIIERHEKEMLLIIWDRPQVLLWMKRATRYLPFIAQQLKERRMPDDLKYLAVAESALRPHAGSSKGAVGFWQLMPETARKYGLTVDEFVDDRRNIFLSTPAALDYLEQLHTRFSSWTMAIAAYNMGEEGLTAEVLEQNTRDYYHLYLSLETQRFVFRVIAAKLVLSAPERYGFEMGERQQYPPLSFDTVEVDCFQEVPIRLIAAAAGTYFKTIKDLNPHIRGHYVQAGHLQINLPAGHPGGFQQRLDDMIAQHNNSKERRIYIVRQDDTLSGIADRFDVPLAALMIWNRIDLKQTLHPGDRLVIYDRRIETIQP